jgi:hypothetical protein
MATSQLRMAVATAWLASPDQLMKIFTLSLPHG